MAGTHNKRWPPSAAARWAGDPVEKSGGCTASVMLLQDHPDEATYYAAEGTVAHEVLTALLETGDFEEYDVGTVHESDGHSVTVDREMHDCAIAAKAYIEHFVGTSEGNRLVECKVNIHLTKRNEDGEAIIDETTDGTADVHGHNRQDPNSKVLHVFDYKYGRGVPVRAVDNPQLALYALGVLDQYGFYWDRAFEFVNMHIIQPRHAETRNIQNVWSVRVEELEEMRTFFAERAHESLKMPTFRPGEKECRWCPLKGSCSALAEHNQKVIAETFDDLDAQPATALNARDHDWMADVLDMAPSLREWFDAVAVEVERRLQADPEAFAGRYKLVTGRRGNRAWTDSDEVERILVAAKAGDSMWNKNLVTPPQAEKRLTPGRWKKVKGYITQPDGKPVVASWDDPREAIGTGFEDLDDGAGLLD